MQDASPRGCIVKIWFDRERDPGPGHAGFRMVETEFPDFAAFCQFVEADRLIGGALLFTRKRGTDSVIVGRLPCAFRGSAVMRCELPRWHFVEGGPEDIVEGFP